jgi:tetratricopeptide (TPR) repeat protein
VAIAADPDFAAAHAGRSMQLSSLYNSYLRADDATAAEAAAQRAIALAPQLPAAHFALASKRQSTLDFRGAADTYDKLLRLPGVGSQELAGAALFKAKMGQPSDALRLADRAVAVDGLNPSAQRTRVRVFLAGRSGQSAIEAIAAIEAADPANKVPPSYRGEAFLLLNRVKEAAAAYGEEPIAWIRQHGQAVAYARLGDRANADKAFTALKYRRANVAAYQIASVHAVRGEPELALAVLAHALATRDAGLANLRVDPIFDALRGDPRFIAIEKQLGFPPR